VVDYADRARGRRRGDRLRGEMIRTHNTVPPSTSSSHRVTTAFQARSGQAKFSWTWVVLLHDRHDLLDCVMHAASPIMASTTRIHRAAQYMRARHVSEHKS
jgi:hypothetical protein